MGRLAILGSGFLDKKERDSECYGRTADNFHSYWILVMRKSIQRLEVVFFLYINAGIKYTKRSLASKNIAFEVILGYSAGFHRLKQVVINWTL
jgi:hypothetical protein